MSTRLGSVVNLATFIRSLMKTGTPHKYWPTIAQLPGVYKPPDVTKFKPNFVAYQVRVLLHVHVYKPEGLPGVSLTKAVAAGRCRGWLATGQLGVAGKLQVIATPHW